MIKVLPTFPPYIDLHENRQYYFENNNKFWSIYYSCHYDKYKCTVKYGRINVSESTQVKIFYNHYQLRSSMSRKCHEKLNKGYKYIRCNQLNDNDVDVIIKLDKYSHVIDMVSVKNKTQQIEENHQLGQGIIDILL